MSGQHESFFSAKRNYLTTGARRRTYPLLNLIMFIRILLVGSRRFYVNARRCHKQTESVNRPSEKNSGMQIVLARKRRKVKHVTSAKLLRMSVAESGFAW